MFIDSGNRRIRTNSQWLVFSLFITSVFISELFFRDPLYNASFNLIQYLQGNDPKNSSLVYAANIFSILGSKTTFIPIIFIVYNYANIYKTYILLMMLLVGFAETSILKMIYTSPRPFFDMSMVEIIGCTGSWGNPSGHTLKSMAFYLTLWHIVTDCKQLREKKIIKNILLVFTVLFIICIMFSRVIVGAHGLNQILFGGLLGFANYFFIFYVLCLRLNDGKQFAKILNFTNIIHGIINFFIFLFAFLIYYFNEPNYLMPKYNEVINNKCPNVPMNERFQNEAIVQFAAFLANIGAFIGIKFEYVFCFGENLDNWNQYNFESNEINDDSSLMTKITINRKTQWNHTNFFYSLIRLFLIALFSAVLVFPYFLFDWDDNIYLVFFLKLTVPANTLTFACFFLFKVFMRSLRMVNMTFYSLNDSL